MFRNRGPGWNVSIEGVRGLWGIVFVKETYLDGLGIKLEAFLLVGQELLNILTLISLQLNHLTHLGVGNNGAIAGWKRVELDIVSFLANHGWR